MGLDVLITRSLCCSGSRAEKAETPARSHADSVQKPMLMQFDHFFL
jgi:hypothetical protein